MNKPFEITHNRWMAHAELRGDLLHRLRGRILGRLFVGTSEWRRRSGLTITRLQKCDQN